MLTSCYYSGPPLFISSDRSYLRYTELFNSLRHKLKVSDTDTASISFLVLHTASMQSNVVNNARNYNPHICCIEVRRIFEHNQLVCGAHNSSVVCSKCSKTQLDAMRVLLSFQSWQDCTSTDWRCSIATSIRRHIWPLETYKFFMNISKIHF